MRHHVTRWLSACVPALALAVGLVGAAWADNDDERSSGTPWLGVYTQALTPEVREGLDLHGDDGVLVSRVVPDSPADRAGVHRGDVITQFGSHDVSTPEELADLVHDMGVNQIVSLHIVREGDEKTLTAKIGLRGEGSDDDDTPAVPPAPPAPGFRRPAAPEAPEAPEAPQAPEFDHHSDRDQDMDRDDHDRDHDGDKDDDDDNDSDDSNSRVHRIEIHRGPNGDMTMPGMPGMSMMLNRGRLGVHVQDLSGDLGDYFDVPGGRGVLITGVEKDTPAERAGLRAGDVITAVDGRSVNTTEQLVDALSDKSGRVSLDVTRKGERRHVEATLERAPRMRMMRIGPNDRMQMNDDRNGTRDRRELEREIERLKQQIDELEKQLDDKN